MSQSHTIQRYADFISRPTSSPLQEKSLSSSDIDALIAKGEEVVKAIMRDDEKTSEEKKTAQSVLSWIQSVKSTWKENKSLHPNAIAKLMKVTIQLNYLLRMRVLDLVRCSSLPLNPNQFFPKMKKK